MRRQGTTALDPLQVAYRLDALLHTMRAIARHEEQLCGTMHAIQRRRTVDAATRQELLELLDELPTQAYQADCDAVSAALGTASPAKARRPATPKRVAAGGGKNTPAAGKGKTPRSAAQRAAPKPPARTKARSGQVRQAHG